MIPLAPSAIPPAHHWVNTRDCRDDVTEQSALGHRCNRLQVREAWVAHVLAVRPSAAVADQVHSELTLSGLNGCVDLALRNLEAFGHQLEVMDQGLHRGAHDLADVVEAVAHAVGADRQLRRPGDLRPAGRAA